MAWKGASAKAQQSIGVRLRLGPIVFGNALGGSLADRSSSSNSTQEDVLGQRIAVAHLERSGS